MEGLVRHLRDGAIQEDGPAALAIICDTLGVVGGPALFKQVWQLTEVSSRRVICPTHPMLFSYTSNTS